MTLHDAPPARPTADWISRYASGLLDASPSLQPLDAIRLAMDACAEPAAPMKRPAADGMRPPSDRWRTA